MKNQKNIKKRQRSANWLEEDKNLLIDLVRERVSAIENKNTDTNTNFKKSAAWADLLNSFNSMCKGGTRSLSQVKAQWSIIKMTKKKLKVDEINKKDIIGLHGLILTIPDETPDIGTTSQVMNVIQEPLQEIENTQKVEYTGSSLFEQPSSLKKPKKKENMNKASAAESIASMETACRKELHEVQMANEERRVRNLDLKESLIKASATERIASMETACRKELHEVQMANEERRARNLDLEESLLKVKIDYYRKRIKLLENDNK